MDSRFLYDSADGPILTAIFLRTLLSFVCPAFWLFLEESYEEILARVMSHIMEEAARKAILR